MAHSTFDSNTKLLRSCHISDWEPVDSGVNPVPPGKGTHSLWVRLQVSQEVLHRLYLLVSGGIYLTLNLSPDLLKYPLRRIEFRTVRWQRYQRHAQLPDPFVPVARRSTPDHGCHLRVLLEPSYCRHHLLPSHGIQPTPVQLARLGIDHQKQVAPLICQLEPLVHLHPAATPDPPDHAPQSYPHLVGEAQGRFLTYSPSGQGLLQPPFFQAACNSGSALACTGRGTLGPHFSRCNRL